MKQAILNGPCLHPVASGVGNFRINHLRSQVGSAKLGLFCVISAFCDTLLMQNAEITWKSSSSGSEVYVWWREMLYEPHV